MYKLTYNNVCLDDTIEGFHTLTATGRDYNGVEIESTENYKDGNTFVSKRVPAREIDVSFVIEYASKSQLKTKISNLLSVLNTSYPTSLKLSDESDKHFTAIYAGCTEGNTTTKHSGTLKFICFDPYKYADAPKTVSTEGTFISARNDGNAPCYVDYKITMDTANSFIKLYHGQTNQSNCIYLGNENATSDRWTAGTVIEIDGATSQIYVNGNRKQNEEVLGSKYFMLSPGNNVINIVKSNGASVTVEATYRERWF